MSAREMGAQNGLVKSEMPPSVQEVLDYRGAARAIIRNGEHSHRQKVLAIVRLAERARNETAHPRWCQEAIWREARGFLETGEVTEPPSRDPVIGTLRSLRRQGFSRCASCGRAIPDDATLDRWEALAFASILESAFSEGAVR